VPLANHIDAHLDTFVADVHVRPRDQLTDLLLTPAAEGAVGAYAKVVHALGIGLLGLMVLAEIIRFVAVFDEADGEHRVASSQLLMVPSGPRRRAGVTVHFDARDAVQT
jgi:hypothetical protein